MSSSITRTVRPSRAELRQEYAAAIARVHELQPRRRTSKQRPPPELDGRSTCAAFAVPCRRACAARPPTYAASRAARRCFQDVVGEPSGLGPPRAAADDDRDELVVSKSGGAERKVFRRGRSCADRVFNATLYSLNVALCVCFCWVPHFSARLCPLHWCATPPTREMDSGPGSIVPRALQERTATPRTVRAPPSRRSRTRRGRAQRDYRAARNYALDAAIERNGPPKKQLHNKPFSAARRSAGSSSVTRRSISQTQLKAAEGPRQPRRSLALRARRSLTRRHLLQKAGTAFRTAITT